jgi:hypothetical protein
MFLQEMTQNQMKETTNQWRKGSKKSTFYSSLFQITTLK